jgi:hypothetical protein
MKLTQPSKARTLLLLATATVPWNRSPGDSSTRNTRLATPCLLLSSGNRPPRAAHPPRRDGVSRRLVIAWVGLLIVRLWSSGWARGVDRSGKRHGRRYLARTSGCDRRTYSGRGAGPQWRRGNPVPLRRRRVGQDDPARVRPRSGRRPADRHGGRHSGRVCFALRVPCPGAGFPGMLRRIGSPGRAELIRGQGSAVLPNPRLGRAGHGERTHRDFPR